MRLYIASLNFWRNQPLRLRRNFYDSEEIFVTIENGNFFENVASNGDVYLLSHIIHDWSEAQCLTILGTCRRAMRPDGRLLIVEMVLPTGDTRRLSQLFPAFVLGRFGRHEGADAALS